MDSLEVWQLSTGSDGISTNSINEVFQMTAAHGYYWLEGRFLWDVGKDVGSVERFNHSA